MMIRGDSNIVLYLKKEELDDIDFKDSINLEKYFEIRPCKITNKETGKRDHGFEIIKIREIDKIDVE